MLSGEGKGGEELELELRRERSLDAYRELYRPDSTEAFRLRYITELFYRHRERVDGRRDAAAAALLKELAEVATDVEHDDPSRLVQMQRVWWARALCDAQGRAEALCRYGDVLMLAQRRDALRRDVPDLPEVDDAICELLERGHAAALVLATFGRAATLLADLRRTTRSGEGDVLARRLHLARALGRAHALHRGTGQREQAELFLDELRRLAAAAHAQAAVWVPLTEALLCAFQSGQGNRRGLLYELEAWAHKPGARQEQREHYVEALAQAQAGPEGAPVELLRDRAYRSDGTEEDKRALFDRLEAFTEAEDRSFDERMACFNEMRVVASAQRQLRLRFALAWSRTNIDACVAARGAKENDRAALAWGQAALADCHPEAKVVLGHCHRRGRVVDPNQKRAREWFESAARSGSAEGEVWARHCIPRRWRWLAYRGAALSVIGLALLIAHVVVYPIGFSVFGVLAYFGAMVAVNLVADRFWPRGDKGADATDEGSGGDGWVGERAVETLRRRPWHLLAAAGEDGLVLVPTLWLGFGPFTAAVAALLFGALHYPGWSVRGCVVRAIAYFAVALLILPWAGILSIAVGHILWDALIVLIAGRRG